MFYWSEGDKAIEWTQQFAWKPVTLDDDTRTWLTYYWVGDVVEKSRFYQPQSVKMIMKQAFTISDSEYVEAKLIDQLPTYGIDK